MENRRLGRGLDALFGPTKTAGNGNRVSSHLANGPELHEIPCGQIKENPYQPRSKFDEDAIRELAQSIKNNGLLQPVLVSRKNGYYELICGERRLRAVKLLGHNTITAIVKECSEEDLLKKALVENIHREDLDPVEKAEAMSLLNKKFNLSHEKLGKILGMNRSTVTNYIRLLELPLEIRDAIKSKLITPGHARAILQVEDKANRNKLIAKIVKDNLSVRHAERLATKFNSLEKQGHVKLKADTGLNNSFSHIIDFLEQELLTKVVINQNKDSINLTISFNSSEDLLQFARKIGYTP